jgi:hypothetical protein
LKRFQLQELTIDEENTIPKVQPLVHVKDINSTTVNSNHPSTNYAEGSSHNVYNFQNVNISGATLIIAHKAPNLISDAPVNQKEKLMLRLKRKRDEPEE